MNALPMRGGAPQWLRELAAARTHYEELHGWPVTIEVTQQCLAAPVGGVLGAVAMPAALGEKVLAELQLMMQAVPVIAEPGDALWIFFTQPMAGLRRDVSAELNQLQVHLIPSGTYVAIPTRPDGAQPPSVQSGDGDSGLRWIRRPFSSHLLPPSSLVVGATRRVAAKLISNELAQSAAPEATEVPRVLIAS